MVEVDTNKCRNCNSSQTYIRFGTNERVCKHCGYIEKLKAQRLEEDRNARSQ
jgi:RNA polymerase subunit RPABC4/transcription elongation factor Spt4